MNHQPSELAPVRPFADFQEAAETVLELLHDNVGMGLWLVTRTEGDDWIVLHAADHGYGIRRGDVFRWSDSFCSRMVRGEGPRSAPSSEKVAAYAAAPIARQVPIGAYVGVPLTRPDGSLFGTLCAIDPDPQSESLTERMPIVEVYARLLATILNDELERQEQARLLERAEARSEVDTLTDTYNRRGWERLRDAEEERCKRYGNPAGILIVDLDDLKEINDQQGHAAGDAVLQRAAEALRTTVRRSDVVARLGGDEFAILAVEDRPDGLERLEGRVRRALKKAVVSASVGAAARDAKGTLESAQQAADAAMYRDKKTRA